MTKEDLSLSKYAVIRSLLDGSVPFNDVMRTYDIHTCECELGPEILPWFTDAGRATTIS